MTDVYAHLRTDETLSRLIDEHGEIPLERAEDPFARLVTAIINQQLSVQSAAAIRGRLFDRYEITPDGIRAADEDGLRDVGLSGQKIRYVRSIADHFDDGISHDYFAEMTDEEVIDDLTEITGVGVWTAKMFLMSVLAREDVFPVEDLGIRNGMAKLYALEAEPAMVEKAEDWRPYRSYASRYIWRAID
ncbi:MULTISPECIES: DNA-3-methyladenine glycosylase [unclassified Haladaptatus]|uniref:DNA-3-methyladenine glycosylase family protein n=1 Tax=unclassified Haladaptatus TaxID=2622732 RepID=UPI0023E8E59A|nr:MULTISPECIES: DNA-3-methyladenine glycosylase 2 family protein [unclassified Haladaptatus]